MVGTSKILTVSYGTFSCTLEGFDDSFNTMKAIAEYFRGLAADDRYFGAEPPTPDAEMLARIAEREISRRVDARMEDDGIVLRAAALTDETATDAQDAAAAAARKAEKAAKKAAKAEAKARAKAEAEAEARAHQEAEEQARKDAQADEEARAAALAEEDTSDVSEAFDDTAAEDHTVDDVAEDDAGAPEADDTLLASVHAAAKPDADAPAEETALEEPDAEALDTAQPEQIAAPSEVPAHPDADSVAAKLQRIRAVVGEADKDPSNDLTEQFLPQSDALDVADVDEDPLADLEAHQAELEEEQATAEDQVSEDSPDEASSPDMIARVLARQSETVQPTPQEDEVAEADTSEEATAEENAAPAADVEVVRMKRADFEAQQAAKAETPDLGLLDGADDLDEYLEDSDFDTSDLDFIEDEDLAEDLDATSTEDETEADHDDTATAEDIAEDAEEDVDTAKVTPTPARGFLSDSPDVDDAALDRLMFKTDEQMQEPESSRRRDAIAQLKAAVAAKEAARQVGEADDDGSDVENAFRDDLSKAVGPEGAPRPRPVVRSQTRTERPRPAPLKLVASQRVDVPPSQERDGPVVPRRVAATKSETPDASNGSFAEFASSMGATALPDLLEAAAAYTSFVEGAEEFSRPQILRRVRAVASEDFNREDGLRSFAELLKTGRFTKVRNGRFQVADDSRFNPERQAS